MWMLSDLGQDIFSEGTEYVNTDTIFLNITLNKERKLNFEHMGNSSIMDITFRDFFATLGAYI